MRAPSRWFAASLVLASIAVALVMLPARLLPGVRVTVCNHLAAGSLEKVSAQLTGQTRTSAPALIEELVPGQCHTVELPPIGEARVHLGYRVEGTHFRVEDAELAYVEPGYHTRTSIQGPGRTKSMLVAQFGLQNPVMVLALVIMVLGAGALLALSRAIWLTLGSRLRARTG